MNTIFKKKKTVLLLTVVFVAGLFVVMMPAVSYGDAAVDVPASDSSSSSGGDTHSSSSARKNTAPAQRRTYQKPYNNNTGGTQGRTYPRSYSNNTGRTQGNTYPRSYGNNMGRSQSNTYPRSYSNNTGRTQGSTYPKSYNNNTTNTQGNTYSGSSTGNAATSSQTQPVKEPEKYTKADIKAAKDSISKIPGLVIKGTKNLIHEIPNKVTVISNGDKKIFYSGNKGELTLRDIKAEIEKDSEDAEKRFYEKGKLIADDIEKAYNEEKKVRNDKLKTKIDTVLALDPSLPTAVHESLLNALMERIIDTLTTNPAAYSECKSGADLVNSVMNQIVSEKGVFKFKSGNDIFTVKSTTIGGFGASFTSGTISCKGKSYSFGFTAKSDASIKTEMDSLKELAEIEIKEAKQAAVDDAKKIVFPDELKVLLKSASDKKVMSILSKKDSSLKSKIKKAKKMVEKYKEFKKAYKGLMDTNLDGLPLNKVVEKVNKYSGKFDAYIDAVNNLID